MLVKDGRLSSVDNKDVRLLKSNPNKFWKKITEISTGAFLFTNLDCLVVPDTVQSFDRFAFQSNFIKEIILPDSMTTLPYHAFYLSPSLEKVTLPKNLKEIPAFTFAHCEKLKEIILPESLEYIGSNAFYACNSLTKITLPKKLQNIDINCFYNCFNLQEINFSNPNLLRAFVVDLKNFSFLWFDNTKQQYTLSCFPPKDLNNVSNFIKLEDLKSALAGFNESAIDVAEIIFYAKYVELLNSKKIMLPFLNIKNFKTYEAFEQFINKSNFKFFKNEIGFKIFDQCLKPSEMACFFDFAYCLGCFSKEKLTDKNGNLTDTYVAQKACSFLKNILDNEYITLTESHAINFDYILNVFNLKLNLNDVKPNQEFLKFLTHCEKKQYPSLIMLLEFEKVCRGSFAKVMLNFDTVKKYRKTILDKGVPVAVPWKEAINNFLSEKRYTYVTEETKDIALEFAQHNIDEQTFAIAQRYRQSQLGLNIKHHILNSHLKEETILENIERLRNEIENKLQFGAKCLDEIYQKAFTYEFLDKYDPKNLIIGLYASCCATISGRLYGANIAKHTAISNDVQNLVIRDINNDIIAKGTAYVSQNPSYVVFNDFEINEKYRTDESTEKWGYYRYPHSKIGIAREKIFKAFLRGIKKFVEEYDLEHPNDPITRVTVGGGLNRLNVFCEAFPKVATKLVVPENYKFLDADEEQYLLYCRDNEFINGTLNRLILEDSNKGMEDENETK